MRLPIHGFIRKASGMPLRDMGKIDVAGYVNRLFFGKLGRAYLTLELRDCKVRA